MEQKQGDIDGYDYCPAARARDSRWGIYKNTKAHYIQDIIRWRPTTRSRIYRRVLYGLGTEAYSG
jgi:hypothetical protein